MKNKRVLSAAFGLGALVAGCHSPGDIILLGKYSLNSTTFDLVCEEVAKFNDSPINYKEWIHFCENYAGEDKHLTYWEAKAGIEGLVTSVKH